MYPSGEITTPLPIPCSICGWRRMWGPKNWPNGFDWPNCCISSGISLLADSGLVREVTVTFTTAGVTRAASVSMALSSAIRAPTLSTSSGTAAVAEVSALAAAGLTHSYVTNEPASPTASTGTASRRVHLFWFSFQLVAFIYFTPPRVFTTNSLVTNIKKAPLPAWFALILSGNLSRCYRRVQNRYSPHFDLEHLMLRSRFISLDNNPHRLGDRHRRCLGPRVANQTP